MGHFRPGTKTRGNTEPDGQPRLVQLTPKLCDKMRNISLSWQ